MTANDPLPSWREGKAKSRIIEFVEQVTDQQSPHYVAPEQRLATFDNDGTLIVEKPVMAQVAYFKRKLLDAAVLKNATTVQRVLHWLTEIVFDSVSLLKLTVFFFRRGITSDEYRASVARWIAKAKHPRFDLLYTELTYQPMLEVLAYFQQHGFSNYIVSGSTANFIRPWAKASYQVTANRVIGSSLRTRLSSIDGEMAIKLEPIPFAIENRADKVLSIERRIALRPIAAFGNSYGDVDMLRWTAGGDHGLSVLIHHTDAQREYKYSPNTLFRLGKNTLTYAKLENWLVVDMKSDWARIFKQKK
jgi:phosphoserine phosphatase